MPDDFLNGDFPCVAQRSGDGFNGIAPFVRSLASWLVRLAVMSLAQRTLKGGSLRQKPALSAPRLKELMVTCGFGWALSAARSRATVKSDGFPSIADGQCPASVARPLDPKIRTNTSGEPHGRIVPIPALGPLDARAF